MAFVAGGEYLCLMFIISLSGHGNMLIEIGKLDIAFRITALVISHFVLRLGGT